MVQHVKDNIITLTKYAKVVSVDGKKLRAVDLHDGNVFEIDGLDIQEGCTSADQFAETEKVTQTELIKLFTSSFGKPFTVVFDSKKTKNRMLRGRLLSTDNVWARSTVEDLDKPDGNRIRLVDHRTLKSMIVDGKRYTLK
jgi:hypothetical protein